ncbi:MAG TPA: CmcJ/NvfI family oxidoreductase [Steroidobacteraceae bacterium]|nr:CmcJ/NvfI family oxidoreductase [Steroidobacteraceae bacterium]
MASRPGAAEREGVEAELFYLSSASTINRRYVAPGAELNTGIYEPHRVFIRNGRAAQSGFSLDRHGFVLARHVSSVADFHDRAAVEARYPREVDEVVRQLTGADLVVPLGWVLRTSGRTSASAQPPASDVHVDMTHDRAERLARQLYEGAPGAARTGRRFGGLTGPHPELAAIAASSRRACGVPSASRLRTGR